MKAKEDISVGPGKLFECLQNYTNSKPNFETLYSNSCFKSINLKITSEMNSKKYETTHGGVVAKHYVKRGEKKLRVDENINAGSKKFEQVKADD